MKRNNRLGAWLSLFGSLLCIVGVFVIFMTWYGPAQHAEAAEPGCEILLKYIMPALADFGILAGALYGVAAYGFFTGAGWAFPVVVIGNVLALQASWFVNVPFMAAGMPPVYFLLFWPNLLLYFLLVKLVGGVSWKRTMFGLLTGIAYVLCLMNGVASMSRIITIGAPIFVLVQRLHWVAMIGWGVVTVGILLQPKEWMRVVGLVSGLLEVVVGIPLGLATAATMGRFSLFLAAPLLCLALFIIFILRRAWAWFVES
jgi:hypothetical protein